MPIRRCLGRQLQPLTDRGSVHCIALTCGQQRRSLGQLRITAKPVANISGCALPKRQRPLLASLAMQMNEGYRADWLHLIGKGSRPGKVALPPLARTALDQHLVQRGLPVTPARWNPKTPLIASLEQDSATSITGTRLWTVMRRFFGQAADILAGDHPTVAEKLHRASPHWMRHTHATHALARGAELTTVRDNLRHASVATTSIYLQSDEVKRARQMDQAFAAR